jgi:UDP-glucose 4-epimerase
MSSILVTGGAGYIGSHTVRALRSAGYDVVVLDTLELSSRDAVLDAALVVGDIADVELVTQLCREHDVDAVVHFAAYKNVGESMKQPAKYYSNNVAGSVSLFDAVVRAGVRRLVFSSSCSVVGTPEVTPVDEQAPVHPESVYAETKAIVERALHWYSEIHGLDSVSLRYFNAAGASSDGVIGENWDQSQNLVPLAMKSVLLGEPVLQVYGDDYDTPDGTCIRDYIHVEDLADAHVRALGYLADGGGTTRVNVGTGRGSSVLEVLDAIAAVAGRTVPHEITQRRAGDPEATFADPTLARNLLGWEAQHGLDHIVATAHRWHSSQLES